MTLAQFREQTAAMPGDTAINVLTPWGEFESAVLVSPDDLCEDDPVHETWPANTILLTGEATEENPKSEI
jgi:hypothetical protein